MVETTDFSDRNGALSRLPFALARSAQAGRIVGRERPLRRLLDWWRERADGLVLVSGEPGVGKTRLLAELGVEIAQREGRVLYGRCMPAPSAPFSPIVEALRAGRPLDELATAHRLLLARLLPELEPDLPVPVLEAGLVAAQRERLFDAIAAALELQQEPPGAGAALMLDDLHWADPSMLLLVESLARRGPTLRVLLLGSSRVPDPNRGGLLPPALRRISSLAPIHEIELEGLEEPDALAAVEDWESRAVDHKLAARLTALTNGNPFLMRSTLRHLSDAGRHAVAGESSALSPRALVAPGVQAIVSGQLDALGGSTRELLVAGAVLGRDFSIAEAAQIAGVEMPDAVVAAERATESGLLEPMSERLVVRFAHALTQDAVLAGLSEGSLALSHLRAGEVIERTADVRPRAAELASHFGAALDVGGAERALAHARDAARQATEQLAFAEAAAMHEIALAAGQRLPQHDEWQRYDELLALGFARYRAMLRKQAQEAFAEAAEIARRRGDARRVASAALGVEMERYLAISGAADERVTALLEVARDMLPEDDPMGLRCRTALLLERCFVASMSERETEVRKLEDLARRAGEHELLLNVLTVRHVVLWHPMHTPSLLRGVDRLIAGARERSRLDVAMHLHCTAFGYAAELNDRPALERHLAGAIETMEQTGAPIQRVRTTALQIGRAILDGRLTEAPRAAERFRAASDTLDPAMGLYVDTLWRFVLARERGGLTEVLPAMQQIAAAVPGDPLMQAVLAETHARSGGHEAARRCLASFAEHDFLTVHEDFNWLGTMTSAAAAVAILGDRELAAWLLARLRPYSGRNSILGVAALDRPVTHAIGLLERLSGDAEAAICAFEAAAVDAETFHAPVWRAHALYELGATLRRAGRRTQARMPLRDALDVADEVKASALVERIAQELRMTGARPRRSRTTGPESLTSAERCVAELAAAGASNARIAETLVLSIRTIETHLTSVYRKLGISGRRQLAQELEEAAQPDDSGAAPAAG